jgi:hypothetical protein
MAVTLIADSGATKAEWCLLNNGKKKNIFHAGHQSLLPFHRADNRAGAE